MANPPLSFSNLARPLVLDGAMGTSIQTKDLTDDDFLGLDGCNEILVLSRPEVITDIHASFLQVGVDLIETNTFGATSVVLAEYDIAGNAYEINLAAARLARAVADQFSTADHPRYVAGSIGPTTKLATLGHISYDALKASFTEQIQGLVDGGADVLLIETCQDLLQIKAALAAATAVERGIGRRLPKMVSVTIELTGTMLVGSDIPTVVAALVPYDIDTLGMNCATGPEEMEQHIRTLSRLSPFGISCVPNAGIPENRGGCAHYHLSPEALAGYLRRFVAEYGVSVIGGCCGTRPDHIQPLVALAKDLSPARRDPEHRSLLTSLYSVVPMTMEPAPLLVGERTNANGSKKFKDLLALEDFDGLVEIGKGQVRKGAHVLDVCTAYVGRDEARDMHETITRFNQQLDVPLMIDSTEAPVIEQSLKLIGGRAIVNSINLEDGEKRLEDVLPMCREFGAAVVALTIDEQGMAKTADSKLKIAHRIHDLCVNKYGLKTEDMVFDVLTFTLGSGDAEFRDAGTETIEAIRRLHQELPGVGSILGISNISFGLDKDARHVLNSVFMHEAVQAGLTMAIVNSAHIMPMHRITEAEREVCLNLIYNRPNAGGDPVMDFISYFETSDSKSKSSVATSNLPAKLEERLQYRIVDGAKVGLAEDLDEALKTYSALDIINTILLEGMKTVGDLFGRGEMQLPFVLQSAETMKKAVAHLEPHMPKADSDANKGVCVLATVKGDVHDIGKNLVDIILTNNGYKVFNLGIKQPVESIAEIAQANTADCIAMSGLLVKSTAIMKDNLQWMEQRSWKTPVILGGAALTQQFVEDDCQAQYSGPVVYARSAFDSLRTMDEIVTAKAQSKAFISPAQVKRNTVQSLPDPMEKSNTPKASDDQAQYLSPEVKEKPAPRSSVTQGLPIPTPPFWGTKIVDVTVEELYPFLNESVLMTGHWGFRRGSKTRAEHDVFVAERVQPILDKMKRETAEKSLLKPQVVYGYFPVQADGESIVVYGAEQYAATKELKPFQTYPLPRGGTKNLCLTDYLATKESGLVDVLPMTIVTVGEAATEYTKELFANDEYTDYFFFHGFAVEMAEALAEYWHMKVRYELDITAKEAGKTPEELMRPSAYQGCRFSYGYPACPDLEDQVKLFEALRPERIGIKLTESFLLEPEQSTSALIFHHPEAYYFDVRE